MMIQRLSYRLPAALLVSFASLLAGCPAKVAVVEVTPQKVSFDTESATKPLTVTLKDADGALIEDAKPATWSSKDPAIASVGADGVVKPVGTGSTTITATVDEHSGTAAVDVLLLKRIQLQSPAMVVVVGTPSDALALNYMNERGEPVVVDAALAKWPVEWKTTDAAIATVSDKGVVLGVAAGSTMLHVTVNELKAEMSITVNPAPEVAPNVVPVPEPTQKP